MLDGGLIGRIFKGALQFFLVTFLIRRSTRTFSLLVAGACCWMFLTATPKKERGMFAMRGLWSLCLQPLSSG